MNCIADLASVKASVLDKNLVGVHSRHNDPGKKNTFPLAFERFGSVRGLSVADSSMIPLAFRNVRSGL